MDKFTIHSGTADLVQGARAGDESAIAALYEQAYQPVYLTIKAVIHEEDTVLDLTQDTFLKAFSGLDRLSSPEKFTTWVKVMARNLALDYLRAKKPMLFSEMAPVGEEEDYELPFEDLSLAANPEGLMDAKETTRLVNEILDTLSDSQRLVIGLFYYEDLSVKEIAQQTGMSESSVKVHLHNGRKRIETKVLELEKNGTKLYGLAPLPYLLWLLRSMHNVGSPNASGLLQALRHGVPHGLGSAARKAGKSLLRRKIVAAVAALSVAGGGVAIALSQKAPDTNRTQPGDTTVAAAPTDGQDAFDPSTRKLDFYDKVNRAKDVAKITFTDIPVPDGVEVCDFSGAGDGSVVGWYEEVPSGYALFVTTADGGPLKVGAYDCEYLFYPFADSEKLTEIRFDNFDTSDVKSMERMFYGCWSLTSLDLSGWDTSNVTYMGSMFLDCTGLTSLDVSGWNTSNVTDMSHMFHRCHVTSLDVSGWDTSNVTDMHYMFLS